MKKSVMKKWVKALRSGKYKQTTNAELKSKDGSYCCLGVLCEISKKSEWEVGPFSMCYLDAGGFLPTIVQEWAGMDDNKGTLPKPVKNDQKLYIVNLAALNDSGMSFKRIANVIEKNYKDL